MRLTKADVIECFEKRDRSYRLALMCTHWLRDSSQYAPCAIEEAKSLQMEARGLWISYSDLAQALEQQDLREALLAEFALTHLYALICPPFEFLNDFCEDYDKESPKISLLRDLKAAGWYQFARIVRNTLSHNFRFDFDAGTKARLPISWNGMTISEAMNGQEITYLTLWHKTGYDLFLEMRAFAEALPTDH
ncbi:hypothetical protein CO671_29770 [Rhizobium sp. M10]|nr:hypothetical protein CO671_29770 [Rhizobium sp. M10]